MNGEFFRPTKRKILLGLALAAFFWFFPIASKSVVAFPFFSLTSAELSVALNVLAAYVFGCALAANFGNRKRLIIVALALVLIYLAVPKIASYSVGYIGGRTETYCDCAGVQASTTALESASGTRRLSGGPLDEPPAHLTRTQNV